MPPSIGQETADIAAPAEKGAAGSSITDMLNEDRSPPETRPPRGARREFREVNRFFNVREANPDTHQDEWLFEVRSFYLTRSDGTDDDVALLTSIAYGITDDLMVELDVMPMNLGDGGDQGNGDLLFSLLYRFLRESDALPAIAGWSEMRIPSGDGSSDVDASLNLSLTKTLTDKLRLNIDGGVETLNGSRGDGGSGRQRETARERIREQLRPFEVPELLAPVEFARSISEAFGESEPGRRSFRWDVGAGLDYAFTPETIGILNYLHRSNEEEGFRNQHILEAGVAHALTEHQVIKLAVDVGLTGSEDTPNLGVKLQWSISF